MSHQVSMANHNFILQKINFVREISSSCVLNAFQFKPLCFLPGFPPKLFRTGRDPPVISWSITHPTIDIPSNTTHKFNSSPSYQTAETVRLGAPSCRHSQIQGEPPQVISRFINPWTIVTSHIKPIVNQDMCQASYNWVISWYIST